MTQKLQPHSSLDCIAILGHIIGPTVLALLLFGQVSLNQALAADDPSLQKAYGLYAKGDYPGCVNILQPAVGASAKNDGQAHYYLGNALLGLGQRAQARAQYQEVMRLQPDSALGRAAGQVLQRYFGSSDRTAAKADSSAGTEGQGSSPQSGTGARLDAEEEQMVTIFRETKDTDFVKEQVASGLHAMPEKIKRELIARGVKVTITPTMVDANPDLVNANPRGYKHGGGYDNCPAMFVPAKNTVFVAERAQWHNSPPQPNRWVMACMLHEAGHAYDFNHGRLTSGEQFRSLYAADSSHLNNTLREKYAYYTQEGDAGPSELFAELFACANGAHDNPGLPTVFPQCYAYVEGFVKNPQ